jgi:hypothetical protein
MVAVINPIVDFHRQVIAHAGRTCHAAARMRADAKSRAAGQKFKTGKRLEIKVMIRYGKMQQTGLKAEKKSGRDIKIKRQAISGEIGRLWREREGHCPFLSLHPSTSCLI